MIQTPRAVISPSPLMQVYRLLATGAAILSLPAVGVISLLSGKRRQTVFKRLFPSLQPSLPHGERCLWVHALSVGETLSAAPVIDRLQSWRRRRPLVITSTTLTGRRIAAERFGGRVDALGYFPFDVPFSIDRAFRRIRPALVILVESDIWPGFMAAAQAHGVPVVLVNARLSERSLKGYRRLRPVARPMLRAMAHICCQSTVDADRFAALGVSPKRISVTGSIKFDQATPAMDAAARRAWRRRLGISDAAPVMVGVSTHPGEERPLLAAYAKARLKVPALRLVVAPRDPRRAPQVCRMAAKNGETGILLAALGSASSSSAGGVIVVDRMGILAELTAIAAVAFIGGSLVPEGGHNPLEAAAHGVPVLLGPDMRDFQVMADRLVAEGGAFRVFDADDMARRVVGLLGDDAQRRTGEAARRVFLRHRGAVDEILATLKQVLNDDAAGAAADPEAI